MSGSSVPMAEPLGHIKGVPHMQDLRPVFLALHIIGGHVAVPILVLTFLLSKRISCHPTLINFCVTWIIYSVSYCLLVYTSHDIHLEPHVNPSLCLAQASMVHGASPMAAVAGVEVVIQLWSMFQEPESSLFHLNRKLPFVCTTLMLMPPYITFCAYALATGLLGSKFPDLLGAPNGLYCSIQFMPLQQSVAIFCVVMMIVLSGFAIAIGVNFCRRWVQIQRAFPLIKRRPSLSLSLRVAVFSLYTWFTLGVCVIFAVQSKLSWPYMISASLPLTVFLVFGTQRDVFQAWRFWKWKRNCFDPTLDSGPDIRSARPSRVIKDIMVTPDSCKFEEV